MLKTRVARRALIKFAKGEGLTDRELNETLEFFGTLETLLDELVLVNPAYGFARNDARLNHQRLKNFKMARETRAPKFPHTKRAKKE